MAVDPSAIRRGALVLSRLPGDKARPAVVIRSDLLAELSQATVLPLTTERFGGVSLRIDVVPSEGNRLREPSQVMVDWPQTVRFTSIGAVIGHLDTPTMRAITQEIAVVLGIGESQAPRTYRTRE